MDCSLPSPEPKAATPVAVWSAAFAPSARPCTPMNRALSGTSSSSALRRTPKFPRKSSNEMMFTPNYSNENSMLFHYIATNNAYFKCSCRQATNIVLLNPNPTKLASAEETVLKQKEEEALSYAFGIQDASPSIHSAQRSPDDRRTRLRACVRGAQLQIKVRLCSGNEWMLCTDYLSQRCFRNKSGLKAMRPS